MTTEPVEQRIATSKFFSGMPAEAVRFLAAHARARHLESGEVLFRYGERADRFFLLESGRIAVEVVALTGPALELQELGPGSALGWSWLIAPHQWSFHARAKTAADLLEFDGDAILARCERDPEFGYQMLKRFAALMSERLEAAQRKMMDAWSPPGFA